MMIDTLVQDWLWNDQSSYSRLVMIAPTGPVPPGVLFSNTALHLTVGSRHAACRASVAPVRGLAPATARR